MNFPDDFLWGAATASYQIEGAANEDGRGASIWDSFSHTPGNVYRGDTGDIACDHFHRLEEDLDLMAELGLKAYRFSVAWPRIQPEGSGEVNRAGLDFYRRLVEGLRRRNIEPMLTLYHWDLPQALEDRGGWTSRETSERFAEYTEIVYEALSDDVEFWITLNEPWVASWLGHEAGVHAPGRRSTSEALLATHHLLLGHGLAMERMRSANREGNHLGATLSLSPVRASREKDEKAAKLVDGNVNRLYLDPLLRGEYPKDMVEHYREVSDFGFVRDGDLEKISSPNDFLGVNFYMRHTVREDDSPEASFPSVGARIVIPHNVRKTAMGWPVEPDGLTELLVRVNEEYGPIPIYVTENGIAVHDYVDPEGSVNDKERVEYLDSHFRAAGEAMERGVDVRGYMVWSLMDNFEWAEGYSKRFGLVYVDYPTGKRIPKSSFRWYSDVMRRGGVGEAFRSKNTRSKERVARSHAPSPS
ncbi:MAG: GH1 family beta-glucosidase [Actinomycetota bacterium]|nr:GH1 family beta-glucosidase [Actinomycetota bacterium]